MRVGILGMGSVGRRHFSNAEDLGHAVWMYDPVIRSCDSIYARDRVFKEADVIVIASPSQYHLQDLKDCLDANKPCLVEKPIGLVGRAKAIGALLRMNEEQKANPVPVAVGYNLRFHPAITKAKEWLLRHAPFYASFGCWQHCDTKAGVTDQCLNHWATHEIDLAQYLLGPLRVLDKRVHPLEVDLRLSLWDYTKPACSVLIHSDMRARFPMRSLTIVADDDSLDYDLQHSWPVTNDHYKAELASFLNWVETGQHDGVLATGYDGLLTLQLCEKVAGGYGMERSA